jgi:hypothetical protein
MPMLALGCFAKSSRLCASALMFLAYGTPFWAVDLATGASMIPTSPLVHVGGPIIAILAVRRLGCARWSWAFAAAASALLLLVSRIVTPPAANVNLAFRVDRGWERFFPSHPLFVGLLWLSGACVFVMIEVASRRLLRSS